MVFKFKNTKSKRTAKYIWKNVLLKTKNYFSDSQAMLELPFREFDTYCLEIKPGIHLCSKDAAKEGIRSLTNIIHEIPEIKDSCSFGIVYKSVKQELQSDLLLLVEASPLRDFEDVLESLFYRIHSNVKNYNFYFSLEGIELVDVASIDLHSILISKFDEQMMGDVLSKNDATTPFGERCVEFVEKNFLDKVCIRYSCFGDYEFCKELSKIKVRETLNFFRYMICLIYYQRIHENLLKINVVSETYIDENQVLVEERDTKHITLHQGSTRKPFDKFRIDQEMVNEMKEKLFLEVIVRILNNSNHTDLEGCLIAAIYWSGEAQNEFDWDISFLKYWTALECIFSRHKDNITHSLAKGISTLAAYGHYQFIKPSEIDQVYTFLSKLYDKRSGIVHRGLRGGVNESELIEICKYTSWTVLSLLSLIEAGYTDMALLEEHTERLYRRRPSAQSM
ncbi:MAG: hypothetical protein KME13_18585 [Myxacorys californica WJT36-NPBG1]|jgi:hypothetical protein|nr:hypothetical protein [Myxacorys californica WJT36-NPBG1]